MSAIFIASCATDRIQFARKENPVCKIPETRYDFGKSIPIREIKSNNRKYTRYVYRTTWRNTHNSYSALNPIRKEKHAENVLYFPGETGKYHIPAYSELSGSLALQELPGISDINVFHYELKQQPGQERLYNRPGETASTLLQGDIQFPLNSADNEILSLISFLKQEDVEGIFPEEFSDEAAGSVSDRVKSDHPQKTPYSNRGSSVLLMALLMGLIPLAAIKAKPDFARNISFWAAMNPWKTRFMYAGIQIGLGATGIILGERLADNGVHFSDLSGDLLLAAFLTSASLYPVRNSSLKLFRHSYFRQKVFDMALALSGFLLMVSAGNNNPGITASFTGMKNLNRNVQENVNISNFSNPDQKQIQYNQNVGQLQDEQVFPQKPEMSKGMKILLTVLTILAGLGLGYLLLLAACGIACNGMEGLAYLVGIGGGILLIVLAVLVIKSIWHPNHKRKTKPSVVAGTIPT